MCTKIMSKPTMISKRPRRLSSRSMMILAVYTIVAVVQIVSADNDTSLSSLIKGRDNTTNTPNDEPAARLLKEKMKVDTNRDLQADSAATNDGTYTINTLTSRLSKPSQNQGRQDNFKRRKNNGSGNGGDNKNTNDRQSSGSGGSGRERQTNGGVGAARNEGRKNRNSNKPQQQGGSGNRKPAASTVSNAKPQGNRQNKPPVGIHGPQKPQQQQKNNVRNKNGNNNANGTRKKKKVPMVARNSNLVVVKNKQKQINAGKRTPNTATAGNARNSHANGFMTTLYGSSGGGKGAGGKGNMRNNNGGGGKKKKMNNGRKRYNGGKNAWSTPTWSVDEKKVWDAGWGTEGIYKPSSSNGWGASSSGSTDSWSDDGWTRADWIELPEREECPCVMVDNPEYIQAQWSSSGQWEPIWGVAGEDSSSNVQPAWGEPTWMTQQAWASPSWSDTSWAAPAWETQSAWGGTWNGGPVIKASSSSSYTSPWSGSTAWWGGRKQRRLDATGTKSRKRRRRRRLGSKSSGGKGGGKSNVNDKSSGDSGDTAEVKQASAWSSSAWESTEKIPEKIKVCTCMPTVSISTV